MTLNARLAAFLTNKRGQWIQSRQIARVAGECAWRTRISDCRRGPFYLTIDNRQRKVKRGSKTWTISEYRLS